MSAIGTSSDSTRLAISVSARLGGAVRRNRARRRTRAAFGRLTALAPAGADVIVTVRKPAIDAPFAELEHSAEALLAALGVLGARP